MKTIKTYSGYLENITDLKETVSGGAATVISEQILAEGGVVFGVAYSEDFCGAEYVCVEKLSDIEKLRGSKYVTSNKMIRIHDQSLPVYVQVGTELNNNRKVLFIGLGCDIGGLLSYCIRHDVRTCNLYTVDIICHGPTLPLVQEKFVKELEKKYKSEIVEMNTRYKKDGWIQPPYLRVKFANNRIYERRLYETDFGYAFSNYSNNGCSYCKFKGEDHIADITIGDYWGIKSNVEGYNKWGVSILVTRTRKGEEIILNIDPNRFHIQSEDYHDALKQNPMYSKSRAEDINHQKFKDLLETKTLHETVIEHMGRKKYYMTLVKRFINHAIRK